MRDAYVHRQSFFIPLTYCTFCVGPWKNANTYTQSSAHKQMNSLQHLCNCSPSHCEEHLQAISMPFWILVTVAITQNCCGLFRKWLGEKYFLYYIHYNVYVHPDWLQLSVLMWALHTFLRGWISLTLWSPDFSSSVPKRLTFVVRSETKNLTAVTFPAEICPPLDQF